MTFDFDRIIPRTATNAVAEDGFENYLFGSDADLKLPVPRSELISMWVADMQFAAPQAALDAMTERLAHPIFGYTMNMGDELYDAFHPWCVERYDWRFEREALQVSLGVIPALYALAEYLCAPGDKILTLTPAYGYFQRAAVQTGHELVSSALVLKDGLYEIDFVDFEAKVKDPSVTLFFLCHPHNPTGRAWTEHELRRVGELCFANGVRVVSDEIHADLLRRGKRHLPLAKLFPDSKGIVTCMAVSKTFNLAGLMLATVIIPDPSLRAQWRERHYPFVNPISLAAAVAVYTDGGAWLDALRTYLDENFRMVAAFLGQHLQQARFKIPDATYLAWVDLSAYFPRPINLTRFFLEKAGVVLEGGEMFVSNGGCHVRLNIACPRPVLSSALMHIHQALAGRGTQPINADARPLR
ncbi:MAG: putative C-S lyase [Mesorhizobium sp.]|uniref:MalY/PatB family protein n=1 Tax=Mesorhizobium sp. TaxID=1871066 RepID=UPI000FEAA1D0|nr:PatB family C-S lyase [Mesorhizobium sp.]RWO48631.1 MAG: putative C-S lyase [Mesorhizobium sp.]TIN25673.1 MAG: putative C-S lyase [Mesorhizobium sp.]TIN34264.1 MAG: putative C-S lyase [Mesorhizobium sp.]TJU76197.1 MAG: putative C-S lyase [Mesorhizobium sp.]TJU90925.1 MAG: putative C-S lyase [Mesorhizobium sp.]